MRVAFNSPARNQFSGESFNGRTAGLQPANEGSIPSSSTSSPGRPLRSRRRSEKPDKRVRLVPLAPSVTVAEWLRRQTVDLSTRVQFPPVTPLLGGRSAARTQVFEACYGSSSLPLPTRSNAQPVNVRHKLRPGRSAAGRNSLKVDVDGSSPSPATKFHAGVVQRTRIPGYEPGDWRCESSRPYHSRLVVQWTGRSPPKAEIPVRPRTSRPTIPERRPTGEVPGCLPGLGEFDSRTLRQSSRRCGQVG
jgi:hypothetical protein